VLPHALLINGHEGTGGLPLALALAQFIFCENKTENDSCGHCAGCSKVTRLEHADLHFSFPSIVPRSGVKAMSRHYIGEFKEFVKQSPYGTTYDWLQHIEAENKQGNLTAEECREIIDTLNLKSYEGGRKILIMWRPEYLGKEGNILLKLIEEPPADTLLIFVAENSEDILQTIRSRTQEIKLAPISPGEIALALTTRSLADPKRAAQAANMAQGSYTEALRLIRETDNDLYPEASRLLKAVLNNGTEIAKFAEDWSKNGREQQKNLLNYIIQLIEQAIRYRYTQNDAIPLAELEIKFVKYFAGFPISVEGLSELVTTLSNTIYYIERNAHSRTQLHALGIRMQYLLKNKPLDPALK
jgi:DNA polymerase-3 subunit delta'